MDKAFLVIESSTPVNGVLAPSTLVILNYLLLLLLLLFMIALRCYTQRGWCLKKKKVNDEEEISLDEIEWSSVFESQLSPQSTPQKIDGGHKPNGYVELQRHTI